MSKPSQKQQQQVQIAAPKQAAEQRQQQPQQEPQYVVEAASLSYGEASELLKHAMEEAHRTIASPQPAAGGRGGGVDANSAAAAASGGGGGRNNNNNRYPHYAPSPSHQHEHVSPSYYSSSSSADGVEALQEAYQSKCDGLERQLNEAIGQRAGLERALHHAAADSLRAQNDVKLAKKETQRVQQQLVMTEAELHKKVEELAKRPVQSESGLAADEELRMRHEMSVLRAEIALLSDLVNRSPDQQLQLLQKKVSELTSDTLRAADGTKQREALLNEVHVRLQAGLERAAHAEDKRDAALSRCATLEDDNAALQRTLEDTTRALRHQTQCAQTFAAALSKQIQAHETSARGDVGRDMAIQERELALFGAGLKTRALLEESERQAALRMHMLRELATDTMGAYAKDRTASRYFTKLLAFALRRRTSVLKNTEQELSDAQAAREHSEQMAAEAEKRSVEIHAKVKTESDAKIAKARAECAEEIEKAVNISEHIQDSISLEREAMQYRLDVMNEEFGDRYSLALLATVRERQTLVMMANQSMISLRETITKEAVEREALLTRQLEETSSDLKMVKAAANDAMRETEQHSSVVERALLEAKRQREKQEAEFKKQMEQQQKAFLEKQKAEQLEADRKLSAKEREALNHQRELAQRTEQLSAKEREALDKVAATKKDLESREKERGEAFKQLQQSLQDASRDSPTPERNYGSITSAAGGGGGGGGEAGDGRSIDENIAREKLRRKWLVENIKHVVDSLEQCYLDDVQSAFGDGLEPIAISNLRVLLLRRAGHTQRVLAVWQKREKLFKAFVSWMSIACVRQRQKLKQHASRSITDLTQKLTRVKDIAQAAIAEKKSADNAYGKLSSEKESLNEELEKLKADYDSLRRTAAMRKAEQHQQQSQQRQNRNQEGGGGDGGGDEDPETRRVLASARSQIEQLSELLKKSRESEEQHARVIEEMSQKLNQETQAAAELKQTIVALLSQAEESGAQVSVKSEKTSESLFVLEDRPKLMRDLVDLLKTIKTNPGAAGDAANALLETHATEAEKQKLLLARAK